jgi:hypothetical protein
MYHPWYTKEVMWNRLTQETEANPGNLLPNGSRR